VRGVCSCQPLLFAVLVRLVRFETPPDFSTRACGGAAKFRLGPACLLPCAWALSCCTVSATRFIVGEMSGAADDDDAVCAVFAAAVVDTDDAAVDDEDAISCVVRRTATYLSCSDVSAARSSAISQTFKLTKPLLTSRPTD